MAVFFNYAVEIPSSGQLHHSSWHQIHALFAIAHFCDELGSKVCFYNEEGLLVGDIPLNETSDLTAIEWHPSRKVIACGLECGDVIVYDLMNSLCSLVTLVHTNALAVLLWTVNGTQLVTADKSGLVVKWEMDSRGMIPDIPICRCSLYQVLTHAICYHSFLGSGLAQKSSTIDHATCQSPSPTDETRLTPTVPSSQEVDIIFFATSEDENGNVFSMTGNEKQVVQRFKTDGLVTKLFVCEEKFCLIILTNKMIVTICNILPDDNVVEAMKVKLSVPVQSKLPDLVSLGFGLLGCCTGESIIRIWDLYSHDNYFLTLGSQDEQYSENEQIVCLAYSAAKGILACGTVSGNVAMWKYIPSFTDKSLELGKSWKMLSLFSFGEAITSLTWGSAFMLLAVSTTEHIYIMHEHMMSAHCAHGTTVVQIGPNQLAVELFSLKFQSNLSIEIQVKGVFTSKDDFVVWDRQRIIVYTISTEPTVCITKAGDFKASVLKVCLYSQNLYTLEAGKVTVRNFQGVVKQNLPIYEVEGDVVYMDVSSKYLLLATTKNLIKVYDLDWSRDAKLCVIPKNLTEIITEIEHIVSIKCNKDASKVSMIVAKRDKRWNPRLYIWDTEIDEVMAFNFATWKREEDIQIDDTTAPSIPGSVTISESETKSDVVGRYPYCQFWDLEDPRLVCVATKPLLSYFPSCQDECLTGWTPVSGVEEEDEVIVSLFVTSDNSIYVQESYGIEPNYGKLLSMETPYFYFTKKHFEYNISSSSTVIGTKQMERHSAVNVWKPPEYQDVNHSSDASSPVSSCALQSYVIRRIYRDFVGFEDADKHTREVVVNFSYYLTVGDLDKAFNELRAIKNDSEYVWESMARMCVKSQRLDVAKVCLARMSNPRVAMALREAMQEREDTAATAVLAFHLQLPEEGIQLLHDCHRYDLLNQYYQSMGKWDDAFTIARTKDRMNLRNTHHRYAKVLESEGNVSLAVFNYENSSNSRLEVPRLLLSLHEDLEEYVRKADDTELYKWWGNCLKTCGNFERAAEAFMKANDVLSVVQLYCCMDRLQPAIHLCNETGNRAACCCLAHHLAKLNRTQDALNYFCRAGTYGPVIRICKEMGDSEQLLKVALLGNTEDTVEVADYFKRIPGHEDKAVMLYSKAGRVSQAVQLAFRSKQFTTLQAISDSLTKLTDPELLLQSAKFLIENFQYDLAVDLLAIAKKYQEAIQICTEQHVPMTDSLVEKLTPPKDVEEAERTKILETIGEVCFSQGEYHLATKKYVEAGNKTKAMKVLLKSGDTEKIIYFAGIARQKEIYIMAANYLQSTDWTKDPVVMRHIISFYKKGNAIESLCNFYISCAQSETDDFKNYEKALNALTAAYEALDVRYENNVDIISPAKVNEIKTRMGFVKQFLDAKMLYEENKTKEAMLLVNGLLKQPNVHHSVRIGDLLGFCINHYVTMKQWKAAVRYLNLLEKNVPKARLTFFVDEQILQAVHDAANVKLPEGDATPFLESTTANNEHGVVVKDNAVPIS